MASAFKNPAIQVTYDTYRSRGGKKTPQDWYQENWKGGRYPQTQAEVEFAQSGAGALGSGMGSMFGPPPPMGSYGGGSGGGGGGGGGGAGIDPRTWSILEQQHQAELGLLGQQEGFAQQGFGLTEQEAQIRRQNMQRMLEMQRQRVMGLELPQAQRQIGNEAAARGSFMSQSRILGQKEAQQAATMGLAEASEEARGQTELLNAGIRQAHLQMEEELARVRTQRSLAELEYQMQLLRKG